jgi:L-ascorbate metabolism protein UlaG (beta-lactamase superfamily)
MILTKHEHSCVRLTHDGRSILIDPGTFTTDLPALLSDCDAVLITHEHPDHFDAAQLRTALQLHPQLKVFGPSPVLAALTDYRDRLTEVSVDTEIDVEGFTVQCFEGPHAKMHDDDTGRNWGYLINGAILHPGDSYLVPHAPVETLLLPVHGPWGTIRDGINYVQTIRPVRTIQIHDGLLSTIGAGVESAYLGDGGPTRVPSIRLQVGETIDI